MHIGGETYQIKFLYIKRTCGESYQIKCLYIKQICGETYQIKFLYIKWICGETYQIKFLYIKWICSETYQMKYLYIKQTYITLDNTPNKISENIFMSFGHNLKYFKKTLKFKSKNTTPGEQKGEVFVYSVQQLLNLILYRSNFTSIQY